MKLLLLFSYFVIGLAMEVRIPAFERRPNFLEFYDAQSDLFLRTRLVRDDYVVQTHIEENPSTSFHVYKVVNQLDYLNVLEVSGSAELNLAVGFLQGKVSTSVNIMNELRTDSRTVIKVIKFRKRTKTERADFCAPGIQDYVFSEVLNAPGGRSHFVTASSYGMELELHVKVTVASLEEASSDEANLDTDVNYLFNSFRFHGKFDSSRSNRSSQRDLSVTVITKNVSPPFPQPKSFEDIPKYLDAATEYISKSNLTGGVLEFTVEEVSQVRHCLAGSHNSVDSGADHSDLVVAKLKHVWQEITRLNRLNSLQTENFRKVRDCFSYNEVSDILQAKANVDNNLGSIRATITNIVMAYQTQNVTVSEALKVLDTTLFSSVNCSITNSLSLYLNMKLTLATVMSKSNVQCVKEGKKPLFMTNADSRKTRFLAFKKHELTNLLKTDVPEAFKKMCSSTTTLNCFLLNCDFPYSVCEQINQFGYFTRDELTIFSSVSETLDFLRILNL